MVKFKHSWQVLRYLEKEGKTNTFRLASRLGIARYEILDIIKELEEKGAVEFKLGTVKFLKFPEKEKKIKVKKIKPKKKEKKKEQKPLSKPKEEEPKTIKRKLEEELSETPIKERPKQKAILKPTTEKRKEPKKEKIVKKIKSKKSQKSKISGKLETPLESPTKAKKVKIKARRLSKEKQEALEQWTNLIKLDIEKLKIETNLLSLSPPNPEDISKLSDSIAKLRNVINQKMIEIRK